MYKVQHFNDKWRIKSSRSWTSSVPQHYSFKGLFFRRLKKDRSSSKLQLNELDITEVKLILLCSGLSLRSVGAGAATLVTRSSGGWGQWPDVITQGAGAQATTQDQGRTHTHTDTGRRNLCLSSITFDYSVLFPISVYFVGCVNLM